MSDSDTYLLAQIVERCGSAAVMEPSDTAKRTLFLSGEPLAAVPTLRPANTDEVAFIVKLARAAGRALVPVGGITGLVDALKPSTGQEWYLSLERMRRIERIDAGSRVAVVEAGVVLQTLQDAVAEQGMLFPVDLGARGSATVGGLISTNAGGERVLRFGMMRAQILGLEVVTANGDVLDLMAEVVKNNAGYDLKQMFIGSEGTLGIVTRAVLRLRPAFAGNHAAFLALNSLDHIHDVLTKLESGLGGTLSAFELMWPEFAQTQCAGPDGHRMPVTADAAAHVLVEAEGGDPDSDGARFVAVLSAMLEDGTIADAAIAQSEAERQAFWAMRNDLSRLLRHWSPVVTFDVSLPIQQMADYVAELRTACTARWPSARAMVYGHVADNNLHVGVTLGPDTRAQREAIAELVYSGVVSRNGSISAEHGIGLEKRESLVKHLPPNVLALMRQLKQWMDPQGLLNPGKVI